MSTILFVGIRTGGSLIHRVFPGWMKLLGVEAELKGVDVQADAPDATYRAFVEALADDSETLGAVITSHKLAIHRVAREVLVAEDPYVDLLQEVNAIARRRDGALLACARDPLAVEAVLPSLLAGHRPPAEALCLGAGGAGAAVLVSLLFTPAGDAFEPRPATPQRVVVTDLREDRLRTVRGMLDTLPEPAAAVQLLPASENARELERLPPGALVVNATGLGKDEPGSPISAGTRFPRRAIVWDANYRGELSFLALARAQRAERALRVHDGWTYFLHGWAEALTPILGRQLDGELFERLADIASRVRHDR
jgi:shikimate dehydrogenase